MLNNFPETGHLASLFTESLPELPIGLERDAQIELPSFVWLQELQELLPGQVLSVDDDPSESKRPRMRSDRKSVV